MGHELIIPKTMSNDTNFACVTTNKLPTGLWTKNKCRYAFCVMMFNVILAG